MVRILAGIILVPLLFGAICIYAPYEREQRIARQIQADGGSVKFSSLRPWWIPQAVSRRVPVWDRITGVYLPNQKTEFTESQLDQVKGLTHLTLLSLNDIPITDSDLKELKGLTNLIRLSLSKTKVTDAGLEHLKGFTYLRSLSLDQTQVTDDGLEHLKGLKFLQFLDLCATNTTKENRLKLAKNFSNCVMPPDIPGAQAKLFPPEPSNRDNGPKRVLKVAPSADVPRTDG